ncbi:MAG: dihydroorotate dehydrogenase electron transfer subunit [Thermodesulfobacteriota bacterium]|nr:dihydroorotate dehydrogenase electron transfer subunit [Thermodesulfobacteriota bacterium]
MIQQKAAVTYNQALGGPYFCMGIACPEIAGDAVPGQFVMVRVEGGADAFLPRPFSIHRCIKSNGIELLYKVVGAGTRQMASLEAGGVLQVVGPLGKGFAFGDNMQRAILVGGGVGVAPLVFLAEAMANTGMPMAKGAAFLGGATQTDILCRDVLAKTGMPVMVATEDGSEGERGMVTDILENTLDKGGQPPDMVFACGPLGMIAALDRITQHRGILCQVSFETMMACGIGACLGCAVPVKQDATPYLHACKDGPVFDSRMIDWGNL